MRNSLASSLFEMDEAANRIKDEVEVIGMAPVDECEHEVFVTMRWDTRDGLAVPLSQLKPITETDPTTKEAVADWHYWVKMGYRF